MKTWTFTHTCGESLQSLTFHQFCSPTILNSVLNSYPKSIAVFDPLLTFYFILFFLAV